jgi:hypothetical protein
MKVLFSKPVGNFGFGIPRLFFFFLFLTCFFRVNGQSESVSLKLLNPDLGKGDGYIGQNSQGIYWEHQKKYMYKIDILRVDPQTGKKTDRIVLKNPKKPDGFKYFDYAQGYQYLVTEQNILAFFYGSNTRGNSRHIYLQAFDFSGKTVGDLVPIYKYSSADGGHGIYNSKYFSPDGTKVGIFLYSASDFYNEEDDVNFWIVFDLEEMKVLSTTRLAEENETYFNIPDNFLVENNGDSYYISSTRDDQKFVQEGIQYWNISLQHVKAGSKSPNITSIPIEVGIKHTTYARLERDGEHFLLTGTYTDNPGEGATGLFWQRMHKDTLSLRGAKEIPFSAEIQEQYAADKNTLWKDKVLKPAHLSDRVEIPHISVMPNGNYFLIAQRATMFEKLFKDLDKGGKIFSSPRIQDGDIVLLRISPKGDLISMDLHIKTSQGNSGGSVLVVHGTDGSTALFSNLYSTVSNGYTTLTNNMVEVCQYKAGETPVFRIQNKYNDLGLGSNVFYWNGEPFFEYNSYTKGLSGERLYNYGLGKFEFK